MTAEEFKWWFDGYTECINIPTPKQWVRIKERVAELGKSPAVFSPYIYTCPSGSWKGDLVSS